MNFVQDPHSAVPANYDCRLHHIGMVVDSIERTALSVARSLGATWDGKTFSDPLQVVRVTFLSGRSPQDPMIELVEPDGERSPVINFLKRGGGLHHLCYEVKTLEAQLEFIRSIGGLIVKPPLPAVAFGGRRIAWVFTKDSLLVEYLEQ
jgi:methylmalonyl-CoA/ethylmalonyl-CoA epimerase